MLARFIRHRDANRILLGELLENATEPRFVYVHEWTLLGDLVTWDNRSTLLRARHYDLDEKRELRRSATADSAQQERALS